MPKGLCSVDSRTFLESSEAARRSLESSASHRTFLESSESTRRIPESPDPPSPLLALQLERTLGLAWSVVGDGLDLFSQTAEGLADVVAGDFQAEAEFGDGEGFGVLEDVQNAGIEDLGDAGGGFLGFSSSSLLRSTFRVSKPSAWVRARASWTSSSSLVDASFSWREEPAATTTQEKRASSKRRGRMWP